jgi:mutator protein MutT
MTPETAAGGPVRVGIGLVRRGDRFLIRRRPPGTAMAGYWEFPGGKCEPGEPPDQAALRECREETGLEVVLGPLRRVITHRYPHAWVEIFYYSCETTSADADPDPATGFEWVAARELPSRRFPEANAPILDALARESGPAA